MSAPLCPICKKRNCKAKGKKTSGVTKYRNRCNKCRINPPDTVNDEPKKKLRKVEIKNDVRSELNRIRGFRSFIKTFKD